MELILVIAVIYLISKGFSQLESAADKRRARKTTNYSQNQPSSNVSKKNINYGDTLSRPSTTSYSNTSNHPQPTPKSKDQSKPFKSTVSSLNTFKHRAKMSGFNIYTWTIYYPVRYSGAPANVKDDRNFIYKFKDGENTSKACKIISDCIYNELKYTSWLGNDAVFAIIPASSQADTINRFASFSKGVAKNLNLIDGYSAITRVRDKAKLMQSGRSSSRTQGLSYNSSIVRGKKVLLFDDVLTMGDSFVENAKKLKQAGAADVRGVFLARTYHSSTFGSLPW